MNKYLTTALSTAVATGIIIGVANVSADDSSTPTLIEKLSQKLNLPEPEIQSALNDIKSERQTDLEAEYEAWLAKAVTDSKITADQKEIILTKHNELQALRQQQLTELENWANDNGIDLQYLHMGGFGPRHGHHLMMSREFDH